MKAVLQRVKRASVAVDEKIVGAIDAGLLVLICVEKGDLKTDAEFFAGKIARMRIFRDDEGKFNRSVLDIQGKILAVSQFTLCADWKKGNRPSYTEAAPPEEAKALYDYFCEQVRQQGLVVETGIFGASMEVNLLNDGPVTIWMDGKE